jgi:hypothetical protein
MVALMMGLFIAAGVLYAVGFYLSWIGRVKKDARKIVWCLILAGVAMLFDSLSCFIALRYQIDPSMQFNTKMVAYFLAVVGALGIAASVYLHDLYKNKNKPGRK